MPTRIISRVVAMTTFFIGRLLWLDMVAVQSDGVVLSNALAWQMAIHAWADFQVGRRRRAPFRSSTNVVGNIKAVFLNI